MYSPKVKGGNGNAPDTIHVDKLNLFPFHTARDEPTGTNKAFSLLPDL